MRITQKECDLIHEVAAQMRKVDQLRGRIDADLKLLRPALIALRKGKLNVTEEYLQTVIDSLQAAYDGSASTL